MVSHRKVSRALVAKLAARSRVVVVLLVVGHDRARFGERPELLAVQTLVTEASVEALDAAVFPRAAWIDVDGLDLLFCQRALHLLGDELRTVFFIDCLQHPVLEQGFSCRRTMSVTSCIQSAYRRKIACFTSEQRSVRIPP